MRKIWLLLLLVAPAFADTPNPDFTFLFNRLPGQPLARKFQLGQKITEAHTTAICVYDYATLGGALGSKNLLATDLTTPCLLPGKAVIRNGYIDVTTAVTAGSNGGLSISSGKAAADLLAFTVATSLGTGETLLIPRFATANTFIKLTTANSIVGGVNTNAYQVTATVATAALTAGHFRVFIDYNVSE